MARIAAGTAVAAAAVAFSGSAAFASLDADGNVVVAPDGMAAITAVDDAQTISAPVDLPVDTTPIEARTDGPVDVPVVDAPVEAQTGAPVEGITPISAVDSGVTPISAVDDEPVAAPADSESNGLPLLVGGLAAAAVIAGGALAMSRRRPVTA